MLKIYDYVMLHIPNPKTKFHALRAVNC